MEQFYDPVKNMFLPDRFIKGECPKCGAKDQYGDSVKYAAQLTCPTDLKNPYSVVSGRHAGTQVVHAFLLQAVRPPLRVVPARVGGRPGPAGSRQQDAGMAGRRGRGLHAERLGHPRVTPRTSASRSRAPRRVLLRLAGRPRSATTPASRTWRNRRHRLRRLGRPALHRRAVPASSARTSCTSTRCSGRPCCVFGIPHADQRVFAHGFLTVDGAKMSKSRGTFITAQSYIDTGMNPANGCATTSRPSSTRARKTWT